MFLFESLPWGERGERKQEREDGDEFLHGKRIGRVCERKRGKLAKRKKKFRLMHRKYCNAMSIFSNIGPR